MNFAKPRSQRKRHSPLVSLSTTADVTAVLRVYMSKLKIFPKKAGKKGCKNGDTPKAELQNVAQNTLKEIIPVPKPDLTVEARAITAAEKEASAYKALKKARTNQKYD